MKKVIILTTALVFVFASMTFAAWKSWEDFNAYKDARKVATEAEASGNTATAVENYKKAAELAGKSATSDIQAWQINNASYVLIKQFKTLVAYDEKLAKLTEMSPSKEKIAFQKEVADLFAFKVDLLNEAKSLLEEGKVLNAGDEPTAKIQSNIDFIDWVLKFVQDNGGTAATASTEGTTEAKDEAAKEEVKADAKAEAKAAPKAAATVPAKAK